MPYKKEIKILSKKLISQRKNDACDFIKFE